MVDPQIPDQKKFQIDVLEAHNKRRALHKTPPVKLNEELNKKAMEWAEYLAKHGKLEHSPPDRRKGLGENLAGHSKLLSGDEVTEMWYSEIKNYDFQKPVFAMNTSHFTQLVWKDCEQIGVGVSSKPGPNNIYLYVANYSPAGNIQGLFDKNVLPKS